MSATVDGRPVGFWVAVAVAIAAVTLGLGVWWVWGLGRGMPVDDMAMNDTAMNYTSTAMNDTAMNDTAMEDMPHTDVRLPPVQGFYDGEEVFFVHPEASDAEVAGMLTMMMAGSPVLVVPELALVPIEARDVVYVFTNGVEGDGPFGFQADVFPSAPGDAAYSPLRTVVLAGWRDEARAREVTSADEVAVAAAAGEIDLDGTDVVVNMPFLTWPAGRR